MNIEEQGVQQSSMIQNIKTDASHTDNMLTVAEIILKQLAIWGVRNIYGLAGDAILPILDALKRQHDIQFIAVRHEFSAGIMASVEGKCTSRIGVCLGTSGPGLVNMLNGLADAAADRIPLLVLTGQVESKKIGTQSKQYINQQQMIAPLAVFSETLSHPEAVIDLLVQALIEARDKQGVAHLSIPKDLFALPCAQKVHQPLGIMSTVRKEELRHLDQAVMMLSSAKRPLLLIGEGAKAARTEIVQLAQLIQAGIIESLGAKGIIPFTELYNVGALGEGGTEESSHLLKQADCVLMIGCNWWPEGFVPEQTQVIKLDISSSSIEGQRQVVCGLVGEAAESLRLIIQRVRDFQEVNQVQRRAWYDEVLRVKAKITESLEQERSEASTPIAPARLISAIEQVVCDDALLVLDTGAHTLWFNRIFRAQKQQVLYSGKWRTMGFALPAAISAKLAYPEKQVFALIGDGCLTMSMMELLTAVKYELPIVLVVVHNKALSMEKHNMIVKGYTPSAVDLFNPNFAQLAISCGALGFEVQEEQDLLPTLKQAITLKQPVLIDVFTSDLRPPLLGRFTTSI